MEAPKSLEVLEYSPRQRFGFIRRHRRKLWVVVLLGVVALAYAKFDVWGKPVWNRLSLARANARDGGNGNNHLIEGRLTQDAKRVEFRLEDGTVLSTRSD